MFRKRGLNSKPLGPLPLSGSTNDFCSWLTIVESIQCMYLLKIISLISEHFHWRKKNGIDITQWEELEMFYSLDCLKYVLLYCLIQWRIFWVFFIQYKSQQCDLFVGLWQKKMCFEYWSSKTYFFQVWKRTDMQVMSRRQHPISERNQRRTYTSRGHHKIFNKWENPP